MRLTFDSRHNIAYIQLAGAPVDIETVELNEELNVDLMPNGRVYGLELLNANSYLGVDGARILIENQQTGRSLNISLP